MRIVLGLVALSFLNLSCTRKTTLSSPSPEPTSEIPAKREFPINASIAPCDNFYQHACSIPIQRFKLREDRNRHIFSLNDSAERILQLKKTYLSSLATQTALSPRTRQLKDSFAACMDIPARQLEEKERVKSVLAEAAQVSSREKLAELLVINTLTAGTSSFNVESSANLADPSESDLIPTPGLLTFPVKDYYAISEVMEGYQQLVQELFVLLGRSDARETAAKLVGFEKRIAAAFPRQEEMHDRQDDRARFSTQAEFVAAYPHIPFATVFEEAPGSTGVRNLFPESFAAINEALANEPLDTLKDAYVLHSLFNDLADAYPDFLKQKIAFNAKYLGGSPKLPERAEHCTQQMMERFEKEIDIEIAADLFPDFPRARFEGLVNQVREAISRRLEKNPWLTPEGRMGAMEKMAKARMQLVTPDNDKEWNFIPVAEYSPSKPLANAHLRRAKAQEKMFEQLKHKRDWSRWSMSSLTINAYYQPSDNKFVMPMGILQPPFFDPELSDAANFGAVGMVVGHELGHGFDNNGSKYDANGVIAPWMPESDKKQFQSRTQILVDQFDAYVPKEINPKYGTLTLGENIADASGLRFAYEAAFPEGAGTIEDKKAFFLQFARVWCGVTRPKELERRYRQDVHAQTEKRVNGPLVHQPGFYEAYGCTAGDAMYVPPSKRMELW